MGKWDFCAVPMCSESSKPHLTCQISQRLTNVDPISKSTQPPDNMLRVTYEYGPYGTGRSLKELVEPDLLFAREDCLGSFDTCSGQF